MRRILLLSGILASLAQGGCGEDPATTAPEDFPLQVEFVPSASTFSNDMDLVVSLTNRSRKTIYYFVDCPPRVERREGDQWVAANLAWQIACPTTDLLPDLIAPGARVEWGILRAHLFEPVPPGVYRFATAIGKMQLSLQSHWSTEFEVTD
jgi:hypothetical protein